MASHTALRVVAALCLLVIVAADAEASPARLVPAVYVFGDSTVDVGNNNHRRISSEARANFPHYGVDLIVGPTGRFSNGYNTADFLDFGDVIPMSQQLVHFAAVVEHMTKLSGSRKTASLLSRSIFFISTGSNDMFEYSASRGDDSEFLRALVATYKRSITVLYRLGARKFSIVSIPPLGCLPSQRLRRLQQTGTQGCFDPLNDLSLLSRPMLAAMLEELAQELPGMAYSLGDAFAMVSFVFANPRTDDWNFTELQAACCGGGPYGAAYACNQTAQLCADRDEYLFWDANHPTQAVSSIAAQTLFAGNRTFVGPLNVKELALL
ncbi:hypothetical protein ACP70R_026478 [Stipagrostis hirtigluma subsp. patula]